MFYTDFVSLANVVVFYVYFIPSGAWSDVTAHFAFTCLAVYKIAHVILKLWNSMASHEVDTIKRTLIMHVYHDFSQL